MRFGRRERRTDPARAGCGRNTAPALTIAAILPMALRRCSAALDAADHRDCSPRRFPRGIDAGCAAALDCAW